MNSDDEVEETEFLDENAEARITGLAWTPAPPNLPAFAHHG